MKKKFAALALALAMCLSLAAPALAAERPEKADEGIKGCYTLTRQGSGTEQFVEKSIQVGYFDSEDYEDIIQGYQPITADTTWTVTNTSTEENSYLAIGFMPFEYYEEVDRYCFMAMDFVEVKRDGSFAYGIASYDDPEVEEFGHLYPGQSVTFSMADALECLERDQPNDVVYRMYVSQYRTDSDQYEESMFYYKIESQGQEPVDPDPVAKFTDVKPGDWFEDAVKYVVNNNLFQGMSDTAFEPDTTMSRAMFVVVLARRDGASDESGELWYTNDVQWAIDEGYYDGRDPEGGIPRQEMALMLYRHAGSPEVSGNLNGFTDAASVSAEARDAMLWAVQNGYIRGMGNNELNPSGTSTRAQVATVFMRVFG